MKAINIIDMKNLLTGETYREEKMGGGDIERAMEIYAEQEAKSFAYWLLYNVPETNGKSIHQLWKEYKSTFELS